MQNNWRKRKARVIPFGYKLASDPAYLEEIPEEREILEKAKKLWRTKEYSIRDITAWVVEKSGRKISKSGLLKAFYRGYI
jgi:hypothetical protein